ncbi:MAG: transposase [Snowella sp.]|nr:transposase [Snowella sp.]
MVDLLIPYAWQEKDDQIILNDVEGKTINVMGIMNTKNEIYYESYETNTNSDKVIKFLDRFSGTIKMRTVILLDQASIHTSDKIMERLEYWKEKNLELFWLPAYSPKLNLIEILWKFMKYEWIEISAYDSHNNLQEYINKTLKLFGSEYVINFA